MKVRNMMLALTATAIAVACGQRNEGEEISSPDSNGKANSDLLLKGDSTVYGLACEGCTDSVIVLLPGDGSDPVTYNIIEAHRNHQVHGRMKVGDWIGLVRNATDSTVADLVIDLDELKGTWCYVVMPRLRGSENLSDAEHERKVREMPDSLKKEFFIPREYGFSLKRQWTAQSVGYVRRLSALEDQSPVVYPQLSYFTEWHILNGQLVMTSGEFKKKADSEEMEVVNNRQDTCDIIYLRDDSLVLGSEGITRSYYRHSNVDEINKLAREKAEKRLRDALKEE